MLRRSRSGEVLALIVAIELAGCTCGALDPNARFACSRDDQCGPGFVCGPANECVAARSGGGNAGGGSSGGGAATSGGSAGGDTAGGDAGGAAGGDAGGGDAGAGGGSAGGSAGGVAGGTAGGLSDGGMSGGRAGGSAGGTSGGSAGGAGGPPRLGFTTPAQAGYHGACLGPITIQAQTVTGQPFTVTSAVSLSLSSTIAGLLFYADASCQSSSTTSATIGAGASSTTVYAMAAPAGAIQSGTITATSGTPAVSQAINLYPRPNQLRIDAYGVSQPLAFTCMRLTLRAFAGALPATVLTATPVTMGLSPAGGMRLYSDATCSVPAQGPLFAPSTQTLDLYLRPASGTGSFVTATTSFGSDTLSLAVGSAIKRGSCSMSTNAQTTSCPNTTNASLSRTLLFASASTEFGFADEPRYFEVSCTLTQMAGVSCTRAVSGAVSTIAWQLLELPADLLSVLRSSGVTCPGAGGVTISPVDPQSSLLLSSVQGAGTNFDADDLATARLQSIGSVATTVTFSPPQGCAAYEFQVATWAGIRVESASVAGFANGNDVVAITNLSAMPTSSTILLTQVTGNTALPNSTPICARLGRGTIVSPTAISFSRAAGRACDPSATGTIAYQRIDFGSRATVTQHTATFSDLDRSVSISLPLPVDPTRTLAIVGGMQSGGLASGEVGNSLTGNDRIGTALVNVQLVGNGLVTLERGATGDPAIFTVYVIELQP